MQKDDVIYRQDAIEAIKYAELGCELEAIEALPSAQPEITLEQIKEYCRPRCLSIITNDMLYHLSQRQPERKTGKWIDAYPDIEPNPMFMYAICSECGCEQAISNKLNFCPDCGADMRGEDDD